MSRSFSQNQMLRDKLLEHFEVVEFNDTDSSLSSEQILAYCLGFDAIIPGLEQLPSEIVKTLHKNGLKVISKYGVGIDKIDLDTAKKYSIPVLVTKGVNNNAVAELSLFFALGLRRQLFSAIDHVRNGGWKQFVGNELSGSTVGIAGLGIIGSYVAKRYSEIGCKVIFHDIVDRTEIAKLIGCEAVSKEELFQSSDVISLHLPGGASTNNYCNEELLYMKNGILINCGRGNAVNLSTLKQALEYGNLCGAALDVLPQEPPTFDKNLQDLISRNVLITPHLGGSSAEAINSMGVAAINNLLRFNSVKK